MRITEPGNVDYDNDGSDNYDYNFVNFIILVLKITKKYTHNMILMSRYKGQLHDEKGPTNSGKALPPAPFSGNARKKTFFTGGVL